MSGKVSDGVRKVPVRFHIMPGEVSDVRRCQEDTRKVSDDSCKVSDELSKVKERCQIVPGGRQDGVRLNQEGARKVPGR